MDLRVDKGKTRLLYLPGVAGGMLLFVEASFWILHLDPLLSSILGAVPVYFFGKFFTENIFAQKPLVVTAPCPECSSLLTVYFGDLFSVQTDGILKGNPQPPESELSLVCSTCKQEMIANSRLRGLQLLPAPASLKEEHFWLELKVWTDCRICEHSNNLSPVNAGPVNTENLVHP